MALLFSYWAAERKGRPTNSNSINERAGGEGSCINPLPLVFVI